MAIFARITHNQKPTYHNILIYQGATFSDTITVKNTDNTAFDLTGWTGSGTIKKPETSLSDTTLTVTVTNATAGIMTISLTSAQTAAMEAINSAQTWSDYIVEITDGTTVNRVLHGQALLEPEI